MADEDEFMQNVALTAKALGCEEKELEAEQKRYIAYVAALNKMARPLRTASDVLLELLDPNNEQKHAVAHVLFPNMILLLKIINLHPTHTCSVERGFSAYKNLHTLLRNSLGEEKVDDLMFLFQNGPELMSPEADDMISKAVEHFSSIKSRRFDLMTYGQTPNATKPVKLNRKRKTRASHVESTRTSLIVTAMGEQEEPEAQAALFKHLVQEGDAADEKRKQSIKARKASSTQDRLAAAKTGQEHEPGSIAADRHEQARAAELERAGRFMVPNPSAEEGSTGRSKRNAPIVLTCEQIQAIASKPMKKKAAVDPQTGPRGQRKQNKIDAAAAAAAAPFFDTFKRT